MERSTSPPPKLPLTHLLFANFAPPDNPCPADPQVNEAPLLSIDEGTDGLLEGVLGELGNVTNSVEGTWSCPNVVGEDGGV